MIETVPIDDAGRLVVPREHRRRLGLTGAGRLQIRQVGDHLELRAAPSAISCRTADDGLPLLEPEEPLPPLTADEVRATLERGRR